MSCRSGTSSSCATSNVAECVCGVVSSKKTRAPGSRGARVRARGAGGVSRGLVLLAALGCALSSPRLVDADELLPEGCATGFITWSPAELVPLEGDPALLSDAVRAFIASEGDDWTLFLDRALDTPRFLAPLDASRARDGIPTRVALVDGDPNAQLEATVLAAREFLIAHGALFGLEARDLCAEADTSHLAGGVVVVFRQCLQVEAPGPAGETLNELPIRGAAARVVVNASGDLVLVKSYLARTPNARLAASIPALAAWSDVETVRARAIAEAPPVSFPGHAVDDASSDDAASERVLSIRAEAGFVHEGQARALWRLELANTKHFVREELRDAATGELLSRCEDVKHFTSYPAAYTAELTDPFAWREDIEPFYQTIRGVLIHEERIDVSLAECDDTLVRLEPPLDVGELDIRWLLADSTITQPGCVAVHSFVHQTVPLAGRQPTDTLVGPCPELRVSPDWNLHGVIEDGRALDGRGLYSHFRSNCFDPGPQKIWSRSRTLFPRDSGPIVFNRDEDLPPLPDEIHTRLRAAVSGWVHDFDHVSRVLQATRRALDSENLRSGVRFRPLALLPYEDFVDSGAFLTAPSIRRSEDGTRQVFYGPFAPAPRTREFYRVQATILAHEAGHHFLEEIIGVSPATEVHEALADVFSAYAIEEPGIGYQKTETGAIVRGPVGRDLSFRELPHGGTPNSVAETFRVAVAQGWWEFFALNRREAGAFRDRPWRLFVRWLASHPQSRGTPQLGVEDVVSIADELLALLGAGLQAGDEEPELQQYRRDILEAFSQPPLGVLTPFVRGDADLDGAHTVTDAVVILTYLFGGVARFRNCRDAYDTDDTGRIDVSDAVTLLNHLFLSGAALPAPFPNCGFDPTADGSNCGEFSCDR